MPAVEPGKIRNVAVVGHRGTGKTSLVEALLYQGAATNRLGVVEQGTTVSDWDEDEQRRSMSISASVCHVDWHGRKINLIDTPGEPSFQGDAIASLMVVEGALFAVSGVMGVEVQTSRFWDRAERLGLSRVLFVNMLDRERADFFRALSQLQELLSPRCVAVSLPIGEEHELTGIVDVLHMKAYMDPEGAREGAPEEIPAELADQVAEYREKLLDAVVETDEALMERYLEEGGELGEEEVAKALKDAVTRGEIFPVSCGVASKNLGVAALLDLLVEGIPSPARKESAIATDGATTAAFVFKTLADPFAGRINVFRMLSGTITPDSNLVNPRVHAKERMGAIMLLQGKDHTAADAFGPGDIGAVAKLKDVETGDLLLDSDRAIAPPQIDFPEPVMSFAISPKAKGDEDKVASGLRRLHEEDPTLILRRDPQTGEQLLSGLSQMHVEVAVDRLKRRFGVEVELRQPRVPYLETIRRESRAQGRYKKQTGGRGQFGDCHIVLEPLDAGQEYEFVDQIVGGVIPQSFRPAVDKGIQEAMQHGELAGAPVKGVRVRLVDGSYHTVDSSEMAFKIAGSLAFKSAYEKADPVLLEPIMEVEATVPDDTVGAVNGDLNSRRGRLHGMEPRGGMTTIRAEVPMAEMLTYSQALTSMTGGRGDYHMHFARYEEVPAHIAQKVIAAAKEEREVAKV
ncbi:MAG: elongation factor G [Thermoleophilia bacterium]|nr:elongation factor G [Thermoleophilia bacterium]